MQYDNAELEEAYDRLLKRQSLFGAMGGGLAIFLVIPAAIIGLFARYLGRAFQLRYRIIAGLAAAALHIMGCLFLVQIHPLWLLLALPNAGVAIYFSRTDMLEVEKVAAWRKQMKRASS